MSKKILILGVAIIMCLGLFAGCSSGIKFSVTYDKVGGFGSKKVDGGMTMSVLEIVNSLQELKDLCDEWENPAFQESNEYYNNELSQKIRSYNEAYFSEKILIVYSFDRGHSKETRIDSITVDGLQLVVNTRLVTKKGTFSDEAFNWLILIEVNKAEITGVATIQVKPK